MPSPVKARKTPARLAVAKHTKTSTPERTRPTETRKSSPSVGDAKSTYAAGHGRRSAPAELKSWQMGVEPRTGNDQDYGFGFDSLTLTKHGHENTSRYPRANGVPDVTFNPEAPVDDQIESISNQMVQLMLGPVVQQVDRRIRETRLESPFDVDIVVNGREMNLAKLEYGSLTPDEFTDALYEVVKKHTFKKVRADVAAFYGVRAAPGTTVNVTGARALARVLEVADQAIALSEKGFGPPLPKDPERRVEYINAVKAFAMKTLFHGENQTSKHVVQGFDVYERNPDLNETLSHDLVDRASIDAVLQIDPEALEPVWARAWVLDEVSRQDPAEYRKLAGTREPNDAAASVDPDQLAALCHDHPEWTVNPNAGEPRYLLSMFHWGNERSDSDDLMNWHRAADHHDGDLDRNTLNIEQKRQNGVEHHAGTEHEGVRHEVRLGYDNERPFSRTIRKIWADSAFQHPFWRTVAMKDIVFQRVLEDRDIITPEAVARPPNAERYEELNAAYQTLQQANTAADRMIRALRSRVPDALRNAIRETTPSNVQSVVQQVEAAAAAATPTDAIAMWQYLQARMLQLAPKSVQTVETFMPVADRAREAIASLGEAPRTALPRLNTEDARRFRTLVDQLPDAAEQARQAGDSTTAAVYESWYQLAGSGFMSEAN